MKTQLPHSEQETNLKDKYACIKIRYIQLALYGLISVFVFGSRSVMPIAIVAMTTSNTSSNPDIPVYNWTNNSIILSSFYWSYAIVQFLAGWIGHAHGPKWYLAISILVESITNFLMPQIADYLGANGVMALRVIQGFAQGFILPLIIHLLGRWAPTDERTWMHSAISVGSCFGAVIAKLVFGYVAASWFGWPAIFYIYGIAGILVFILWIAFGCNSPAEHSYITEEERKHIEASLGQEERIEMELVPWKSILSSLPFWAIIVASVGESWASTLLATETPTFLAKVVALDITSNGIFLTVPNLIAGVATVLYGPIIDFCINKNIMSRKNARKIFNSIGIFIPAVSVIVLTYVSKNHDAVLGLLILTFVTKGAIQSFVNILDISPRFSGILTGFANGVGQFVAMFAPVCVQFIVSNENDVVEWRIVFVLTAIILGVSGLFFNVFMSGKRQWWDSLENGSIKT